MNLRTLDLGTGGRPASLARCLASLLPAAVARFCARQCTIKTFMHQFGLNAKQTSSRISLPRSSHQGSGLTSSSVRSSSCCRLVDLVNLTAVFVDTALRGSLLPAPGSPPSPLPGPFCRRDCGPLFWRLAPRPCSDAWPPAPTEERSARKGDAEGRAVNRDC